MLETNPDEHGTSNMITNNASKATLTTFKTSELLGFSVKLLNFPTQAAHLLSGRRVILSQVVGHDKVRALSRQHKPEEFHAMSLGKVLDLDQFAMCLLVLIPGQ